MATKSILENIILKNKKDIQLFVDAVEQAEKQNKNKLSISHKEIKKNEITKFLGIKA